ncbi:MAG: bile acid:sodium symporter family protein [Gammaproteobacteria bacterium]|nr:bile acid:sodium symporter family protein [Gammaproteobacteria bacterium]
MWAQVITRGFPWIAIALSAVAAYLPQIFVPLKPAIVPLLGLVMFGMGMTLTFESFRRVLRIPGVVALGVGLQFLVMPLAAWLIAVALRLPPQLMAGLVLVGACPGGTASNVVCYLSKGNVALSITLTAVSTVVAVFMTPVLTWLYVGQTVPVPVGQMLLSILKIVVVPVTLGVLVNTWLGPRLHGFRDMFPALSVLAIVLIIAIIVAVNEPQLQRLALPVIASVMLHNLLGLGAGYWLPRWLGQDQTTCRTLAIEVGMQNSGLGVALAMKYFSAAAALPGAVFSIWHNLSGAALAAYWGRRRES